MHFQDFLTLSVNDAELPIKREGTNTTIVEYATAHIIPCLNLRVGTEGYLCVKWLRKLFQ